MLLEVVPGNWNALGAPTWAPALGRTLPPPNIHLEDLQGQLAGHCQENTQAQFLTAVPCHCMCYLMPNLSKGQEVSDVIFSVH